MDKIFMVSCFTNGFTTEFVTALSVNCNCFDRFVYIPCDFEADSFSDCFAENTARKFADIGAAIKHKTVIDNRTQKSEAMSAIAEADILWLGGGDP